MAYEAFPSYPSIADAIEAAEQITVRWGHGNVRHLSAGQVAAIVEALRAKPSEMGRIVCTNPNCPTPEACGHTQEKKEAARYRWLNGHFDMITQLDRKHDNTGLKERTYRLKCGPELDRWIDDHIKEESAANRQGEAK